MASKSTSSGATIDVGLDVDVERPKQDGAPPPAAMPFAVVPPSSATNPYAVPATHHTRPLVVGAPGLVQGEAVLAARFDIGTADVTNYVVTFPPGSVLLRIYMTGIVAYNGTTPKLTVGVAAGGSTVANITTLPAAGATVFSEAPVNIPSGGATPWQLFINLTGASTAGQSQLIFQYMGRPAAKWS